ncbi:uncharacterized protein Hen1 [Fopius arisanus]|uniref:Small RNA 2'-O-methyltransferase n=1 Tax=Fopius arisanus TaxID=64838 RepID=A0A9R1T8G7_9HYME|nr:PREDICTED: uncharacterized protein LOC105267437 [Fopius arisanus]
MIIVFFHVLFLLGKFIYRNYRDDDPPGDDAEENHEIEGSTSVEVNPSEKKKRVSSYDNNFYGEEGDKIRFSPPAYIQRYHAVATLLQRDEFEGQIRKVVDFGCSELGFFQHLKNTRGIEEILCVDVDRETLERNKRKVEPLTCDYLSTRDVPLTVHILEGSVTDNDEYLENCDAVICIELIEHLYPDTCLNLPLNIFGFIQPKVAVFTTPNADFNVLFKGMTGFRHWDHKFEWSRKEFEDWASNITTRYPNYRVEFSGVCSGPPGSENLGCCSQMATFIRQSEKPRIPCTPGLFKLVSTVKFPYRIDNRSSTEKIVEEATYYLRHYSLNSGKELMGLEMLAKWIDRLSVNTLTNIVKAEGWPVVDDEEMGPSVLCPPLSEYSGCSEDGADHWGTEEPWQQDWLGNCDADEENCDDDEENWDNESESFAASHQIEDFCGNFQECDEKLRTPGNSKDSREYRGCSHDSGDYLIESPGKRAPAVELESLNADVTLDSICSMYFQPSTCENNQNFPNNVTNEDFNDELVGDCSSCLRDSFPGNKPNFTSTPVPLERRRIQKPQKNSCQKEFSQLSDTCSSCQQEKNEVMRKLKASNSKRRKSVNESNPSIETPKGFSEQEFLLENTKKPIFNDKLDFCKVRGKNESENSGMTRPLSLCTSGDLQNTGNGTLKDDADKMMSEAKGSPPNSWSPEVMDSGYPNTSSAQDITPECELSSIGQDRISESESPSLAEPPRPLEVHEVENGDLANNNRDGEGNNVIALGENELDDLQPLINVLENDLENENDIYDFQNGFPLWLLRILDAEGALHAVNIHRDEGFDSSDDEDREEVDENENIDEI